MYEIFKNVILSGKYELTDILKKIDVVWVEGGVSETEKTELIELAQANANTENSIDLLKKVEELDKRVKALEEGKSDNTDETVEYPEYVVGKWYYNGDKVTFNGKNYVCVAPDGQVCTWNPDEYPVYWKEIE